MLIAYCLPLLLGLVLGCQKDEVAKAPESPVHNVVTEYVANGVTAMHKADSVAQTANTQNQQTQQQAQQSAQEP